MVEKTHKSWKIPGLGIKFNPEALNEIHSSINDFSDRYHMKLTMVFVVSTAISQYTKQLSELSDNYKQQPPIHDEELFNKLILGSPNVNVKTVVQLSLRMDTNSLEPLILAIEEFNELSGSKLTRTSAIRAAIILYTNKLRHFCNQRKFRKFNEEEIIKAIMP
jgi:hypothetical protein